MIKKICFFYSLLVMILSCTVFVLAGGGEQEARKEAEALFAICPSSSDWFNLTDYTVSFVDWAQASIVLGTPLKKLFTIEGITTKNVENSWSAIVSSWLKGSFAYAKYPLRQGQFFYALYFVDPKITQAELQGSIPNLSEDAIENLMKKEAQIWQEHHQTICFKNTEFNVSKTVEDVDLAYLFITHKLAHHLNLTDNENAQSFFKQLLDDKNGRILSRIKSSHPHNPTLQLIELLNSWKQGTSDTTFKHLLKCLHDSGFTALAKNIDESK